MQKVSAIVFAILGAFLCGYSLLYLRTAEKIEQNDVAKLFRYRDANETIVYVDRIEKVPEAQRQSALEAPEIPRITRADYDAFVDSIQSVSSSPTLGGRLMCGASSREKDRGDRKGKESGRSDDRQEAGGIGLGELVKLGGSVRDRLEQINSVLGGG